MGSELNSNVSKTKAQLISEVGALRQRVAELESAERDRVIEYGGRRVVNVQKISCSRS